MTKSMLSIPNFCETAKLVIHGELKVSITTRAMDSEYGQQLKPQEWIRSLIP